MKIKICVNSTKNYSKKTIPIIIPSLIESGICKEDIFVFEGGHDKRSVIKKNNYTLIELDHNSIDFTGLIDIVENEIESDYWFNIHDTCKVGTKFCELLYNIPQSYPDKIALYESPSMNIGLYKYSYLLKHTDKILNLKNKDYSEKQLKKKKEWCTFCEDYIMYMLRDSLPVLYNSDLQDKIVVNQESWYGERQRIIEYYPQLDLYKCKANYHRLMKPIIEL